MSMGKQSETGDSGQVLVQVALLMIVFLILLALAVDVGHLYQVRRQMQNAADAGALAGARELCFGWPILAEASAWWYAFQNGGQDIDVAVDGNLVTVVSRMDADTYFAGIIGIDTVNVGADAQAACGAAKSACGLWPVALSLDRWNEVWNAGCGVPFYVWSGDNANDEPDCLVYDCDVNGDDFNDIVPMLSRAWLDFSDVVDPEFADSCAQPGCGADELVCYVSNDSGAPVQLPACIAGDTGVKAGVKDAVDARTGDVVAIPLFDYLGCMGATCPGTSIHAVAFGCIEVRGWVHSLELPRLDGELPPWKDKVIKAWISCGSCDTFCGGTTGGPVGPGGVKAVSLLQ